jgi:hypothetical protein
MNLKELAPQKSKRLNKVMESRFGFKIDYSKLTYPKAEKLYYALGESLDSIRKSYGSHTAERNPKYMEMLIVREGLQDWLNSHQYLVEGELETAEAVLAAKDMVDSVQDMITDASKMMNEELPPLIDTIKDQVGTAQADQFKATVTAALQSLMDSLNAARDALDNGARSLAGEQIDTGAEMGSVMGGTPGTPPPMPGTNLPPPELGDGDDGFAAADAAAGGGEELGRKRR